MSQSFPIMKYYIIDYLIMPKKLQIYLSDNNYNFYRESNVEIRDLEAKLRQARINKQVIKNISLYPTFSIIFTIHVAYLFGV